MIFLWTGLAAVAIGALLGYLMACAPLPGVRDRGPDCDRCGEPTGRPYLRRNPRLDRHCADCENWITDMLFGDTEESARFRTAWLEMREARRP